MSVEIHIPRPAPYMTMNDRDHWRSKANKVKTWRRAAGLAAYPHVRRWNFSPSALSFVFEVPDRRRRDPHNYYPTIKAIVDGLVDAGYWPDDTPEYVSTTEPTFRVVPRGQTQHVTVSITDVAP